MFWVDVCCDVCVRWLLGLFVSFRRSFLPAWYPVVRVFISTVNTFHLLFAVVRCLVWFCVSGFSKYQTLVCFSWFFISLALKAFSKFSWFDWGYKIFTCFISSSNWNRNPTFFASASGWVKKFPKFRSWTWPTYGPVSMNLDPCQWNLLIVKFYQIDRHLLFDIFEKLKQALLPLRCTGVLIRCQKGILCPWRANLLKIHI